jgi:2-C-methyl-D-erythritol 2,4-cyclodiphosphate synthase
MKIGFGYDVHAFSSNRKMFIGGIEIKHGFGLLGHSDADVLLHAICDAMLGALALGDIGKHFPNTDPKYKDADSKTLLKEVNEIINKLGYVVENLDSTVVIESPKISPHIESMRKVISEVLSIGIEQISIKATTSEHLGFVGRKEGAAAFATVLLTKMGN